MAKITFSGLIGEEWLGGYGDLMIGQDRLISSLNGIDINGKKVFVKYYIADHEINEQEAIKGLIKTLYGDEEHDSEPVCGTEWTGQYSVSETFKIDGHDFIEELSEHHGKYCYLEINY